MSETSIDGSVQGAVQSGTFSAPVQTVAVNLPEPPQNLRDQILEIWKIVARDQLERQDAQAAHRDLHREVTRRLDHLEAMLKDLLRNIQMLRVIAAILTVANVVLYGALGRAWGWW